METSESTGQPAQETTESRVRYTTCGHEGPDVTMTEDPRGSRDGIPHWLCGDCLAIAEMDEEARQ